METNVQMLVGFGLYMAAMITMGLWYSLRHKNESPEEYFLAKRKFGPWLTALSAQASDMSGWLLMGLPGVAYFFGFADAFWTILGLFIGTWVNWVLVAKRLRSYSQIANNAITLPEFFSKRFHDDKRVLLAIAAVISLLFFSIYVGAQFIVVGTLFQHLFGFNMVIMIIIGALVVLAYTLIGGFLAVGVTDMVQGMLMVTSLTLVMVFGIHYAGGFSGIYENLQAFPNFMSFFGIAEQVDRVNGVPIFSDGHSLTFLAIISTMAWGLGYFGMPQVLVRFMAVNKISSLKQSIRIAVTWVFIAQVAAVAIGIIGRSIFTGEYATGKEAESIFILMSQTFFPPLLAGIVISGILAASMSSSDSYLLIVSSSLANDIYKGIFNKNASEKKVMWIARITMLMVTIFGIIVAATGNETIFQVVAYAWAGLGASFGPLVLFSLFWKRTTFPAAVAGMLTGGSVVLIWRNFIKPLHDVVNVYELLPAFIISCLVILIVSLNTQKPSEAIEKEFEAAKTVEF
ncbi:MAG: sodium/proline symporter [Treponema sp.]|nr:sodium/proline symporter [Treponema sp.]